MPAAWATECSRTGRYSDWLNGSTFLVMESLMPSLSMTIPKSVETGV